MYESGAITKEFQSTPSARRATSRFTPAAGAARNFNPRPPRGGRHDCLHRQQQQRNFNPRPPRGGRPRPSASSSCRSNFNPRPPRGGRHGTYNIEVDTREFQSTPSARRATVFPAKVWIYVDISIHALREEGDVYNSRFVDTAVDFNPRPPRGGRLLGDVTDGHLIKFQSTPSARRATATV